MLALQLFAAATIFAALTGLGFAAVCGLAITLTAFGRGCGRGCGFHDFS